MLQEKQFESVPDTEIIRRIINGEVALFEILIKRNNASLYKTGRSYGFNHQDVEDLMQETFISAFQNLLKFKNRSSFRTWAMKIMLNQCHQKAKKLSFKNEKASDTSINENTIPMFANLNTDTNKIVINRELINMIQKAILQIPIEYRMVFSCREIIGLSISETAEALEITEVNVKVRLSRAKHMLRKQLEGMYSSGEIFEFNLVYCDSMVKRVMNIINRMN